MKMASLLSLSSPWPDMNSPILSKINFGVPVADLLLWLDVRDNFLGHNFKLQDITAALALAQRCKHPDAKWLTSIFEGKNVSTNEEALKVFLAHDTDARALCFAWWLNEKDDDGFRLTRSVEQHYAFAIASKCVGGWGTGDTVHWAKLAAAQHERDGFFGLGNCFRDGCGCEQDFELAKDNFLIAAELGSLSAAEDYAQLLDDSDPTRWIIFGRLAQRGFYSPFLRLFPTQVRFGVAPSIMYLIGRALKGNVDLEKKEIFGPLAWFDEWNSLFELAAEAISFYEKQIKSAHLAVHTWSMVATRLKLIKDMRIYVCKMIWDARYEANYAVE